MLQESLEPKRPIGNVKHTTFIKNNGTMLSKKVHNYNFTTTKGNKVDLQCKINGEGEEDVVFYVNGRLSDDAKQVERGYPEERNRRQSIYKKLLDKYVSIDWNIEQVRNHFTLTRK